MQQTVIIQEEMDVDSRLQLMGLRQHHLRESVKLAHIRRSTLTPHHPRIMFGLVMWGDVVAALRDQLITEGYAKLDKANYELTINHDLGIAIAVASGDQATGTTVNPSNKCPKGINTVQAIEANIQIDMFAELLPQVNVEAQGPETWILLHFTSEKEIRLELSRPSEIDADGMILRWKERIILEPIPIDSSPIENITPPQMPDIDIDIQRKKA